MPQTLTEAFDKIAGSYDAERRKLIPCFDDFYKTAVYIAKTGKKEPEILDIGAGTGLFAYFLRGKYPAANFTLIDISEKMLNTAKERFSEEKKSILSPVIMLIIILPEVLI